MAENEKKEDMFIIQVKKREDKNGIGFRDLQILHADCAGGRIDLEICDDCRSWRLKCQRCHAAIKTTDDHVLSGLFSAAISGEETISTGKSELSGKEQKIKISQKS